MPLSPGSQVAGYKVISLLGSGGMGEVYLVENPHLLRKEALKVISLAGAHDPDFQKRFTNEPRTTASLDHPSIISIHQYGINDEGTPWFTMSYLEGRDLSSGPTSPADVVAVTAQVADALDYAHRHHVIHRDVKPANIIVTRDPSTGDRWLLEIGPSCSDASCTDLLAANVLWHALNAGNDTLVYSRNILGYTSCYVLTYFDIASGQEVLGGSQPRYGTFSTWLGDKILAQGFMPPNRKGSCKPSGMIVRVDPSTSEETPLVSGNAPDAR